MPEQKVRCARCGLADNNTNAGGCEECMDVPWRCCVWQSPVAFTTLSRWSATSAAARTGSCLHQSIRAQSAVQYIAVIRGVVELLGYLMLCRQVVRGESTWWCTRLSACVSQADMSVDVTCVCQFGQAARLHKQCMCQHSLQMKLLR